MAGYRQFKTAVNREMSGKLPAAIFLSLVFLILWSCSKDEHPTVNAPEPPHRFIDFTTPSDESIDVPVISPIIIQFLRPMDVSTMTGRKFYFSGDIGYTFTADSMQATIYPTRLRNCAEYQVIVDSGIVALDGDTMTTPYSFRFRTETGSEFVSTVHPLNGAIDTPLDDTISVKFTKDMDPSTIHEGTFYVDGYGTGAITYSNRTAMLTSSDSLESHRTYTVTLKSSIADTSGTTLGEDYTWSFTTRQRYPIYVVSESPTDGESMVSLQPDISITFSREIDPASVTPDEFTVGDLSGSLRVLYNTIRFIPDSDLAYDSTYVARFTGEVSDRAGNVAQIDHTWSFTTVDSLAPEIVSMYPEHGITNASIHTDVWIVFSKPLDPDYLDQIQFTVTRIDKTTQDIVIVHDTVKLTPGNYSYNKLYEAAFSGRVSDMFGVTQYIDTTWSFRTFEHFDVVSRYPETGCVPVDEHIIVEFNRDIDPATVIPDNFLLEDQAGNRLTGTLSSHDSIVVFDPDAALDPLTEYRMKVHNVTDTLGYGIWYPRSWYFTTRGENLLPLAVGNIWRYNVYTYEGWTVSAPSAARIDSISIVDDTLIEGKRYFRDQRGDLYRYENDSIEISFKSVFPYSERVREFENLNCGNGGIINIDTELGEFLCQYFRIEFSGGWYYRQEYDFAPDIGLIRFHQKREPMSSDPSHYEVWELIGYEIQ